MGIPREEEEEANRCRAAVTKYRWEEEANRRAATGGVEDMVRAGHGGGGK
jgi:hypothetical protein